MNRVLATLVTLAPLMLASCGTTSGLTNSHGAPVTESVRKFSKATVQNFRSSIADPDGKLASARSYFADRIAAEMKKVGGFRSVDRNARADADTLVIDGDITRYAEGDGALRFLVGFGAGSAYFDATVDLKDANGVSMGELKVDKNSWALGGGFAAAQTPQSFMDGAATKVAAESRRFAR